MVRLNKVCPSCGADGMRPFYSVPSVPVHSCLMFATEEEAGKFPRGRVELGFCETCGFVSNMAFDPTVQDYSPLYEDQQCYSPTFNAFAERLAARLVEKYDLRGRDILEIGCGKGDFLSLICRAGDNRGVGIDPACDAERIDASLSARITLIQDYYSERYGDRTGDMVLCRHTLEHIHATRRFLEVIRRGIGDRRDTIVSFEVPDVTIVLDDFVFWDVYYEHCSYFSPGSLARLFRSCGFEVLDLYRDFDDQYLLLDARPASAASSKAHPLEESLADMSRAVERFRTGVEQRKKEWTDRVRSLHDAGKRPVVWGSGSKCVAFLTTLGLDSEIGCIVDINPHRHGKYIAGAVKKIMPPDCLKTYQPGAIIVMNPIYKHEVADMARGMGLSAEVFSV